MKSKLQPNIEKIDRLRYKRIAKYCIGKTLDVACGLKGLSQYIDDHVGCDVNGGDILASAYHLPFTKDSYDTVVLAEVLEHLDKPLLALKEAARVCQQRIIITVPNDYSLTRLSRVALGRYADIEQEHILSYNDWNLKKLLERINFKIKYRFCFPFRLQLFPTIPIRSRFGYWLFIIANKENP